MKYYYRPVVILAKSYKLGQRCIAGIFYDTGEWVRPVSREQNGSIDKMLADSVSVLDIVEIPFFGKLQSPVKYQRENWLIGPGLWKKRGVIEKRKLLNYCENDGLILHTDNEYVAPEYLNMLPPSEWKSLQLVKVQAKFFEKSYSGKPRKRVLIEDGEGNELDLPVTDEEFLDGFFMVKNKELECLITISLGLPWQPATEGLPLRCYKLAAGIILL